MVYAVSFHFLLSNTGLAGDHCLCSDFRYYLAGLLPFFKAYDNSLVKQEAQEALEEAEAEAVH